MHPASRQAAPPDHELWCPGGRRIRLGSCPLVMGVLNLTPDSFSDGGRWQEPDLAVERAEEMVAEGADLLDLGAESTRPGGGTYGGGAKAISTAEEMRRLIPVLERVRERVTLPLSVDTRNGQVARAALESGADLVNDISALSDPRLAEAVSEWRCPVVLMHSRGSLATMQQHISFRDLLAEVSSELEDSVSRAEELGIDRRQILIDPGIGFGKTGLQNRELLARLDQLHRLELPILVGASRKSFIGEITGRPPHRRQSGSLAAVAWAARHRAAIVRVHDVADTVDFLKVWRSIETATETPP